MCLRRVNDIYYDLDIEPAPGEPLSETDVERLDYVHSRLGRIVQPDVIDTMRDLALKSFDRRSAKVVRTEVKSRSLLIHWEIFGTRPIGEFDRFGNNHIHNQQYPRDRDRKPTSAELMRQYAFSPKAEHIRSYLYRRGGQSLLEDYGEVLAVGQAVPSVLAREGDSFNFVLMQKPENEGLYMVVTSRYGGQDEAGFLTLLDIETNDQERVFSLERL